MSHELILRIVAIILAILHFYFMGKIDEFSNEGKTKRVIAISVILNLVLIACVVFADVYISLKGAQ